MFFYLSKLLNFIALPLTWIFVLLLIAFFKKNTVYKKRFITAALLAFYLFSNEFILNEISYLYETPAVAIQAEKESFKYGVVLGGMVSYDPSLDRVQYKKSVDRLLQAVDLFRKGVINKIVFTGGSGSIVHQNYKEGNMIKNFFKSCAVPDSCVIIESESRNTYENALELKKIMSSESENKMLLITSSYHMPRAMACFKKQGFNMVAFSTDRIAGPTKFDPDFLLIPSATALTTWEVLIHEWIGIVSYWLMGYI